MDKPEQFKYQTGKIADVIFNNWHLSTDNFFSLFLDDLLTNFGFNNGRHYRAVTEKERSALFELGQLYAQAVIDHPYCDVLGRVYEEVASRGQKQSLAQYFSPMTIADAMSKITLHDAVQQIKNSDKDVFSVGEPSSGSGVMMLSILKELKANNPELINKVELTLVDLDICCVKMSR